MDKNDRILVCGALGIGLVIAYLYWQNQVGDTREISGQNVEDAIGARMPYFARGGHYGAFSMVPEFWEKHRLVYPRRPCANMEGLLQGDMNLRAPNFDADDCAWFSDPPSESVF